MSGTQVFIANSGTVYTVLYGNRNTKFPRHSDDADLEKEPSTASPQSTGYAPRSMNEQAPDAERPSHTDPGLNTNSDPSGQMASQQEQETLRPGTSRNPSPTQLD